jgi:hypothetical protein
MENNLREAKNMKKEELRMATDDILETAKRLLVKDGGLVPMAFIVCGNNVDIKPLSFRDNDEKHRQLSLLRDYVKKKNVDAIVVLAESWYVTSDSSDIILEPSKDPTRKECILMTGEDENGNFSIVQIFDREGGKENGKVIFGERVDVDETISLQFNFGIKDRKKQNIGLRDLN